jgi:hypothetical protein
MTAPRLRDATRIARPIDVLRQIIRAGTPGPEIDHDVTRTDAVLAFHRWGDTILSWGAPPRVASPPPKTLSSDASWAQAIADAVQPLTILALLARSSKFEAIETLPRRRPPAGCDRTLLVQLAALIALTTLAEPSFDPALDAIDFATSPNGGLWARTYDRRSEVQIQKKCLQFPEGRQNMMQGWCAGLAVLELQIVVPAMTAHERIEMVRRLAP